MKSFPRSGFVYSAIAGAIAGALASPQVLAQEAQATEKLELVYDLLSLSFTPCLISSLQSNISQCIFVNGITFQDDRKKRTRNVMK